MVFLPKSLRVFGAALGLYNVLGARGHWLGPMGEPDDLARRTAPLITCSSGYVACGNSGCVSKPQCCNQNAGWACLGGNACYTVAGTVDCYSTSNIAPSTARSCHNYADAICTAGDGCFRCIYTDAPYCYTEVLYGTSEIWVDCYSTSGLTVTVGYITMPAASTSSGSSPTSYTTRSTVTSGLSSTITPGPVVSPIFSGVSSPSNGHSGISVGAIAGIAIGGIAVIAIIGVLAFLLWKKSQNRPQVEHAEQPVMEPGRYQPPLTPAPGLPQYQPVAGQPAGLHNSYQEPPKGSYYPPQSPFGGQPGGAYGQAGGMHTHAEMHRQGGGPVELS